MTSIHATTTEPRLATWIEETARVMIRLPSDVDAAGRSLASLGLNSLNAIALQYRLQNEHAIEVTVAELMGDLTIFELARDLESRTSSPVTTSGAVR